MFLATSSAELSVTPKYELVSDVFPPAVILPWENTVFPDSYI